MRLARCRLLAPALCVVTLAVGSPVAQAQRPAAPVGRPVGPRFVAPDGTVSTIRRVGRRMEERTDSVVVDAGTVLVARSMDTGGGLSLPHGVRHVLRGDTLEIVERPAVLESGSYSPERFDVRVRRLPPGSYLVRYRVEVGGGKDHLVVERRVVLR